MIKLLKKQNGFTLIEMMIVLVIISILLLVIVPNLTKNQELASDKGCEATVEMVKAQVIAFQVENNRLPATITELKEAGYIETTSCPGGAELNINNGMVTAVD